MWSWATRIGLLSLTLLMIEVAGVVCPAVAAAQGTTGTITGRVTDAQGLAAPGATIVAASPNLQGSRSTVSSATGDYILTLLPAGAYIVSFNLAGFAPIHNKDRLAPSQILIVDAALGPAPINEVIQVGSVVADAVARTAQAGATFTQRFLFDLPTNRDIFASVQLAPSVHSTGPLGAPSISGGPTFANLYLINGVPDGDNLRGQPYDLYIEDALEQTAIGTAGISAEYGRFTGGVVNVVTKSGGNRFGGSLRDTLVNDKWRTLTPFEDATIIADPEHLDTRSDRTVPTYEYTFGGPVLKDRIWFFTAGRAQTQRSGRTLAVTRVAYEFESEQQRFEGKATWSQTANHRLKAAFIGTHEKHFNQLPPGVVAMDLRSLYDEERPSNLSTVEYNAIFSSRLSFEARLSARNETLKDVGGTSQDLIEGTQLVDRSGRRYWAPSFCGVCGNEQRDGQDLFVKGSYFMSARRFGTHATSFGYDGYDDRRYANNYQSGSGYRIGNTNAIPAGSDITAQFISGSTYLLWQPIQLSAAPTKFRTHSGFISDNWRVSDRISANVGVRYDYNHAVDSSRTLVATTDAWSPRLGVVIDLGGSQKWILTASVSKYIDALANTIANMASAGGNADAYQFIYTGPSINADTGGPLTPTADGIRQVFEWFSANQNILPIIPIKVVGVTPIIGSSLDSPSAWEYAGGVSRQFGAGAAVRADVTYRTFGNFYALRTDSSTGLVGDTRPLAPAAGNAGPYDLSVLENTNLLTREYAALLLQGQYRIVTGLDGGATYTLSRAWGDFDGESASGPAASGALQYPEYKKASWSYPTGDLSIDQRHRLRIWATYRLPHISGLSISGLQIIESGVPYGAVGVSGLDFGQSVQNPGYATPPAPAATQYYFTNRDAFRTEGQRRADLAISYVHGVKPLRGMEVFGQLQVLNVFDQSQLCACGALTALQDGGSIDIARIDQTVSTAAPGNQAYQVFNPFTTAPVEGINWARTPAFGTAVNRFAYTTPRTMRLTFGVRF